MPETWEAVENVFKASMAKANPVMALAAMGETAMLPVITELGTVEMPAFERMTKSSADPRFTVGVLLTAQLFVGVPEGATDSLGAVDGADDGEDVGAPVGAPVGA